MFFFFLLSADNMVDQTKVETSEAKANELEKKVKEAEMLTCQAHMNKMLPMYVDIFFVIMWSN